MHNARRLAATLACLAVAACSGGTAEPQGGSPPPVARAAVAAAPPPVTVAAAGDIHGEGQISDALVAGRNPLAAIADALAAADLTVVNVETAVGDSGSPAAKQYTFQAPPALWDALLASGVDVVTLANNHALDYGRVALAETIAGARAAGLTVVGAGADAAEAYAPAIVDVNGRQVAVVGLSRVLPVIEWAATSSRAGLASAYDEDAAVSAVRAAAAVADSVVVTIHWGRERQPCPDDNQLRLAAALAGAGADLIVGHHPHVLQGAERIGETVVAYSLGNFLWYTQSPGTVATGVLHATLGDSVSVELVPAHVGPDGQPVPVAGAAADFVQQRFAQRSAGSGECAFPR